MLKIILKQSDTNEQNKIKLNEITQLNTLIKQVNLLPSDVCVKFST